MEVKTILLALVKIAPNTFTIFSNFNPSPDLEHRMLVRYGKLTVSWGATSFRTFVAVSTKETIVDGISMFNLYLNPVDNMLNVLQSDFNGMIQGTRIMNQK